MPHSATIPAELDAFLVSPALMENPYPIYARLREESPVAWSERWQSWVVSRYDDVNESLREKETLSNEERQELLFSKLSQEQRQSLAPLRHYFGQKDVIGSDLPDHNKMRAAVAGAFTPKLIASLEPRIRELVGDMTARAAKSDPFDLIGEIAHPLPVMLLAEILGSPREDRHLFKRWAAEVLAFQGTGTTSFDVAMVSQKSLLEMFTYMSRMIDDRMENPRDDLLTTLAGSEKSGVFTRDQLLASCNTILSGGHETTTNLIGNLVHLLLSNPEQWELLKSDPSLIDSAVEEALRFDAPKQRNFRRVKKSHTFKDVPFEENQMVFQLIGSANHDPLKFNDPDKFDIRRAKNEHLTFGAGIHFCIGAFLARKEAKIVLQTILETMPGCRLSDRPVQWQERVQFRGPRELWIERG